MKALLIIILAQHVGAGTIDIKSPTVIYFSSLEECERQKSEIVRAVEESVSGSLRIVPTSVHVEVNARCSSIGHW